MHILHKAIMLLVGYTVYFCEAKMIKVNNSEELLKALEDASPGDTIGLGPHDFKGAFIAAKDGTKESPITIVADDRKFKEKCRIIGDGTAAALTVTGNFWDLQYFAIENKNSLGLLIEGSNNTVSSVVVEFVEKAIQVKGESNTLDDVAVRDATMGIYLEASYNNVKRCAVTQAKKSLVAEEGTCCGVLENNSFDGDCDIKGTDYKSSLNVVDGKPDDV